MRELIHKEHGGKTGIIVTTNLRFDDRVSINGDKTIARSTDPRKTFHYRVQVGKAILPDVLTQGKAGQPCMHAS
jgi:hypothetical protein